MGKNLARLIVPDKLQSEIAADISSAVFRPVSQHRLPAAIRDEDDFLSAQERSLQAHADRLALEALSKIQNQLSTPTLRSFDENNQTQPIEKAKRFAELFLSQDINQNLALAFAAWIIYRGLDT